MGASFNQSKSDELEALRISDVIVAASVFNIHSVVSTPL